MRPRPLPAQLRPFPPQETSIPGRKTFLPSHDLGRETPYKVGRQYMVGPTRFRFSFRYSLYWFVLLATLWAVVVKWFTPPPRHLENEVRVAYLASAPNVDGSGRLVEDPEGVQSRDRRTERVAGLLWFSGR
jgi:hypothetical protein